MTPFEIGCLRQDVSTTTALPPGRVVDHVLVFGLVIDERYSRTRAMYRL